jgi:antitoxin StbD
LASSCERSRLEKDLIRVLIKALIWRLPVAHRILAATTASVSELKKNPMGTVAAGEGFPVAILNRNEPAFYCVPAKAYEAILERIEDLELNAIADAREGQAVHKVSLDDL